MATTYRRRLPNPRYCLNIEDNVSLDGISLNLLTSEMSAIQKKRLTPEVVAMLLSEDTQLSSANHDDNTIATASRGIEHSDIMPSKNIGIVNIVKQTGQPLGFSLKEYDGNDGDRIGGIVVSRITAGGIAEKQSLLYVGDEILLINGVPVNGYKLGDVVAMIQIPKRLVLKVRFNCTSVSKSKENGDQANENNNNTINGKLCDSAGSGNNTSVTTPRSYSATNLAPPNAPRYDVRRTSSGRQLPTFPEQEKEHVKSNGKYSDRMVNYSDSKTLPTTSVNQVTISHEANNRTSREQNTGKRPTVLPITNHTTASSNKNNTNNESVQRWQDSNKVDPGDIRFDLVNNRYIENKNYVQREPHYDESKSLSFSHGKESDKCDSSSSLSSTDSPKAQERRPFCVTKNTDVFQFETSCLSKNNHTGVMKEGRKNSAPELEEKAEVVSQNSLSDDLAMSQNSWFSKLNRKNVRKISEGLRSPGKSPGKSYRIQDSTDQSNDEVDAGYKLYYGSNIASHKKLVTARAVTGMVALHIVKACRISTPSDVNGKDKRKKLKVFCTVDSDDIRQACTGIKKGFTNFQWNESFEIEFQRSKKITINVLVRSKKDGERCLAQGMILLSQLVTDGSGEHSLALCLEPYGTLYIHLQFTDIKVLLQRTPSQKKEGLFGVPLETVLRRENTTIPLIIRKCVESINIRGIEITGIYRLCGNAAKKKVLRAKFEDNCEMVELDEPDNLADVNVITGLLKDYLRELPQPLLSQDIREILSRASSDEDRSEVKDQILVDEIRKKFSRHFKDTIIFLLDHFVTVVMNFETNKMDSHNLAVCIGPVISCPSLGSMTLNTVNDTKNDINAVRLLLDIWPKPEQVSAC